MSILISDIQVTPVLSDTDVIIAVTGSIAVGTEESCSSETYALKFSANSCTLSLSGNIALFSNTSGAVYGIDFGNYSGEISLGTEAVSIKAHNDNGIAISLRCLALDVSYLGMTHNINFVASSVNGSGYGIYGNGQELLLTNDDFGGNIHVLAKNEASGIHFVTNQSSSNNYFKSKSTNFSTAMDVDSTNGSAYGIYANLTKNYSYGGGVAEASIDWTNFSSTIDVDGFAASYGIFLNAEHTYYSQSTGLSTIAIGNYSGSIDVTSSNSSATGIYACGASKSSIAIDSFAGTLTVKADASTATGLQAEQIDLKKMTGTITVSGNSVYGIYASKTAVLDEFAASHFSITGGTTGSTTGIYAGNNIYLTNYKDKFFLSSTGTGSISGFSTQNLHAENFAGEVQIQTETSGAAKAINVSNCFDSNGFKGKLTVDSSNGSGYGIYGNGQELLLTNDDFGGNIHVSAKNEASGIHFVTNQSSSNNYFKSKSTNFSTAMDVDSTNGSAYGIYANLTKNYSYGGGVAEASIDWTNFSSTIDVDGFAASYGIFLNAEHTYYSQSTGLSTIAIGNYSGSIDVTSSNSSATGIYACGASKSSIALDSFAGTLTVKADTNTATGLRAEQVELKKMTGTITVSGNSVYGIDSVNNLSIDIFAGKLEVSGRNATAIRTKNTNTYAKIQQNISEFSGSIVVNATSGEAIGFHLHTHGDCSGNEAYTVIGSLTGEIETIGYTASHCFVVDQLTVTGEMSGSLRSFGKGTADSRAIRINTGGMNGYFTGGLNFQKGMSGSILAVSAGNAYGISAYSKYKLNIAITEIAGTVVTSGKYAFGIEAESRNCSGKIYGEKVNDKESSMLISGLILADATSNSVGILGNIDKNITVTGIIASGDFGTGGDESILSDLENQLRNFSKEKWNSYKLIESSSNHFAIADGKVSGSWIGYANSNDNITIASGALILGNIALSGGTNKLTVSSGALIYGDISASSLDLIFNLDVPASTEAVITANAAGALTDSTTNYIINITSESRCGRYILASADDLSALENKTFTVNYLDETYTVSAADDFEDNPLVDINIVNGNELELVLTNTFFVYNHSLANDMIGKDTNGFITLTFSKALDETSFSKDLVSLTDKNGQAITITDYTISGNKLTLNYTPLTAEGTYTLKLSEKIRNVDGGLLDQNLNQTAGEADDAYTLELTADFTAPKVAKVSPDEDFAGTLSSVKVYFSSAVDFNSLKNQVKVIAPSGKEILPTSIIQLNSGAFEFVIPDQTAYGNYQVVVGNGIKNLAGNSLDCGEASSVISEFNIADIDLEISKVSVSKDEVGLGEYIAVNWTLTNPTQTDLRGSWTDGIYISTDEKWDINDRLIATYEHTDGMKANTSLDLSLDVALSGVTDGDYYILVRSDIFMNELSDEQFLTEAKNVGTTNISIATPSLTVDQPSTGLVKKSGDFASYKLTQNANETLRLALDSSISNANMEIYVAYGYVPTREKYDLRMRNVSDGVLELPAGVCTQDAYILVYAKNAPSEFTYTLTPQSLPMEITGISPSTQGNSEGSMFEITGVNFQTGVTVSLKDEQGNIYIPDKTSFISSSRLRISFDAGNLAADNYDVVISSGSNTVTQEDAITIIDESGYELNVSLNNPSELGYHLVSKLSLTYSNTGYDTMDAPLIIVKPTQTHASGIVTSDAILTLDSSLVKDGFWVKNMPEGFSSSIQILGTGNLAGSLAADGKTYSTTIYYTGWLQRTELFGNSLYGWDPSRPSIEWNIITITADNTQYLNWGSVFKNTGYSDELNAQLSSAFSASVGHTWGNYVGMLNTNLRYLDELGYDTSKITGDEVFKFEVLQEVGLLSPYVSLLMTADKSGSDEEFTVERTYNTDLISRDTKGSFGYGWISNLDAGLSVESDGDVIFRQGATSRLYQVNWSNGYQTVCGDGSVLKKLSTGYRLTESDGTKWIFNSAGKIQSLTGSDGKTVNYSYDSNGNLSRISGEDTLTITRNDSGLITQIKDASGTTTYQYSENGDLIAVTDSVSGKTETYEYADEQAHALTRYTDKDGNISAYSYTSTGLLSALEQGGKNISITYGKDGDVTLDSGTESITLYYNIDGNISKLVNNKTKVTNYYYFDSNGNFSSGLDSANAVLTSSYTFAGETFAVTAGESADLSKFAFTADYEVMTSNYYVENGLTCYKTDEYGNALGQQDNPDEWYLAKYDADDKLISYTEYKDTITTTYTYTDDGYSVTVDDPSTYYKVNGITYYKRDSEGNVVAKNDTETDSQTHGYDADGNLVYYAVTSSGSTTEYTYTGDGNLSAIKDANGTISYTYDTEGRMTSMTSADGSSSNYTYYDDGTVKRIVNSDGSSVEYNTQGNVTKQTDASGNVAEYSYTYDDSGNMLTMLDSTTGISYAYTYNADNKRISASSTVNGETTSYTYDANGNTTGITYADGSQVAYEYDADNRMTQFTDANNQKTQYAYNENGKVTAITYADNTTDLYTYDTDDNCIMWTNRAGKTVTYTVQDGKTTRIQYADGRDVAVTYNADGELTKAGEMSFGYDADGNVVSITYDTGAAIAYGYTDDNMTSLSVDGLQSAYTYTEDGSIDTIRNSSGVLLVDYDYDADGNLNKVTKGNGTYSTYTYSDDGKVMAIDNYTSAGVLNSYSHYAYDADGNISRKITESGCYDYTYDKLGQLLSETFTASGSSTASDSRSYTYDAAGNRLTQNINGTVTNYTYNNLNQIVKAVTGDQSVNYSYDANGNLLDDGERTYTWTTDNKVASETLKSTGESWSYSYNALGYRTATVHKKADNNTETTRYAVDSSGNVLAEYLDGVLVKNYIQGNGLAGWSDNDGNTYYFNSDLLGTTTEVTDAAGTAVNTYKYDAWGNVLDTSSITVANDFTYVGSYGLMSNDSGTYYVRARNYDSQTGRWISADPIGIDGGNNLYAYCGNSPICSIDISGFSLISAYVEFAWTWQFAWFGFSTFVDVGVQICNSKNNQLDVGVFFSIQGSGYLGWQRPGYGFDIQLAYEPWTEDIQVGWYGNITAALAIGGFFISVSPDLPKIHSLRDLLNNKNWVWAYGGNENSISSMLGIPPVYFDGGRKDGASIGIEGGINYARLLTGHYRQEKAVIVATSLLTKSCIPDVASAFDKLSMSFSGLYDKVLPIAALNYKLTTSQGQYTVTLDASNSLDINGLKCGIDSYYWFKKVNGNWEILKSSKTSSILVGQYADTTVEYGLAIMDNDGCYNENGKQLTLGDDVYFLQTILVSTKDQTPVANVSSRNGTSYTIPNGATETSHTFNLSAANSYDPEDGLVGYQWSCDGKVVSTSCDYSATVSAGSNKTYTLVVYDDAGQASKPVSISLSVTKQSKGQTPYDPNDKIVSEGYGEKGYIVAGQTLNYMIEFENDPDFATAPAHWVRVYDTLDTAKVDISSFELSSFCIAGNYFEIGDGRDSFNDTVTLNVNGTAVTATVAINLETDEDTGKTQLVCEFMAIDPTTGAMLMDVDKGILAVNDALGSGEGWIKYSLKAAEALANGTEITNTADIYFDFNGKIETPTTLNTVDNVNPMLTSFTGEAAEAGNTITFTLDGSDADSGISGYNIAYSTDGEVFTLLTTTTEKTYTCEIDLQTEYYFKAQAIDNVGNLSDWSTAIEVKQNTFVMPEGYTAGTFQNITWDGTNTDYLLAISKDNFATAVTVNIMSNSDSMLLNDPEHVMSNSGFADITGLSAGEYQWRAYNAETMALEGSGSLTEGADAGAEAFVSKADGRQDVIFAQVSGKWTGVYVARHVGNLVNNWTGTSETINLSGKNKIEDIFVGSDDGNVLILTDDAAGDALFLDDIYTNGVTQSRISGIDEIRAGAGDDIIDLTSTRYAYAGKGITVYGGDGNDTIWAVSGENILLGDTGNDRIIGGANNDVIAGGSGNDRLHGGGGDDIFAFSGNFGSDTVEQLADGTVTLWFSDLDSSDVQLAYSGSDTILTASTGTVTAKNLHLIADNLVFGAAEDHEAEFERMMEAGVFSTDISGTVWMEVLQRPAVPEVLRANVKSSDKRAVLGWQEPAGDVTVAKYEIRYSIQKDMTDSQIGSATANTFTFENLPEEGYYWQVRAIDACGNASDWSEISYCSTTVSNLAISEITGDISPETGSVSCVSSNNVSTNGKNATSAETVVESITGTRTMTASGSVCDFRVAADTAVFKADSVEGDLYMHATSGSGTGIYIHGNQTAEIYLGDAAFGQVEIDASTEATGLHANSGVEKTFVGIESLSGTISLSCDTASVVGVRAYSAQGNSSVDIGNFSGSVEISSVQSSYAVQVFGKNASLDIEEFEGSISQCAEKASEILFARAYAGDSQVNIGNLSGEIGSFSGTNARGVFSSASGSASVQIGELSGTVYASAAAANARAYGIGAYASGDSYVCIQEISGVIMVDGENGYGIHNRSLTGKGCIDGGQDGSAMIVSGMIMANTTGDSYGIAGNVDKFIVVTGAIYTGSYESDGSKLRQKSTGVAIFDGYLSQSGSNYTMSSCSSNDIIAVSSGAQVFGDISLGGGQNSLYAASGACIYGDITGTSLDMQFVVGGTIQSFPIISAYHQGALLDSSTTYTITCGHLQNGSYGLIRCQESLDFSSTKFKVVYGDESTELSADGTEFSFDDNTTVSLDMDGKGVLNLNVEIAVPAANKSLMSALDESKSFNAASNMISAADYLIGSADTLSGEKKSGILASLYDMR